MAIELNETIDVQTLPPFKKFIMTIGNIPTSYLESMSYAELLMWFCNYLQETVIPTVNNNADAVEELQGLYEELHSYVENYFNNLDVQIEINNKLDQMAQDGSLTALIKGYVDPELDEFKDLMDADFNQFKTEIDNQISALASGEPKGVYSTTADLISANPQTGVYLVTADGYVYSFVHNASSVTQLVQYQSTGMAENSISAFELDSSLDDQLFDLTIVQPSVTNSSHYRIADGVAVEYTTTSAYSSFTWPVTVGEIYKLHLKESSGNTYGCIFVDNLDDMTVIQSSMQGTGAVTTMDNYVKVPAGATYMLCSMNAGPSDGYAGYKVYKCTVKDIKALNKSITKDFVYEIPKFTTTTGKYWYVTNGTVSYSTQYNSYNTVELSVSEGEAYYVSWEERSANTQLYLVADNSNNVLLSGGYGTGNYIIESANIVIPKNGTKLLLCGCNLNGMVNPIIRKKASLVNYLTGKNISVLGDSISTKINKNAVEIKVESGDVGHELSAYLTYYDVQNSLSLGGNTFTTEQIGSEVTFTPVEADIDKVIGLPLNYNDSSVKTFWELLEDNFGCTVTSVSWSGASLSSHQKNEDIYKTSYGWHDAQIRKLGKRTAGSMDRVGPDLVIIYRGVNDFSHSPYTTINTTPLDGNYTYPSDDYNEGTNSYDYISALGLVVKKIRQTYPDTRIAICTLGVFKRVNYANYPTRNTQCTLPKFNEAIRKAADFFGLDLIELDKDGITFENCYSSGYITDSATTPTHPNSKGHEMIYKQVVKDLQA